MRAENSQWFGSNAHQENGRIKTTQKPKTKPDAECVVAHIYKLSTQ